MDLDFVSVHKLAKKELGQYPAILTSHLVNNPYLFFSQASERAGCLNPRIWLANLTQVIGPAFHDTAHGPDFFPLNAVPKFRS